MRTSIVSLSLALLVGLTALVPLRAEDGPTLAPGESTHQMHGLKVVTHLPKDLDPEKPRSMIVVLHGNGGTAVGMARSLAFLAEKDYAIVAPKSTGVGWENVSDLKAVKQIVVDMKSKLNVAPERLHGMGFSNGGWNLHTIVFDEELGFTSGAWMAAGHRSGSPAKKQAKTFDAIGLVGAQDGNRSAAEEMVGLLADKVRSVEVHVQPNLGHEFTRELMPYYGWWVQAIEGRFELGWTMAFPWSEPSALLAIRKDGTGNKGGAFAYVYGPDDAANEETKALENELLRDRAVQFYGRQIPAFKLALADAADALEGVKLKETPAIVTFDKSGKPKKVLTGKFKAKSIASALKSVAITKKMPK